MSEHTHETHREVTPADLLKHMAEHNRHHMEELEAVATSLEGEAKASVEEAIALLKEGNDKLEEAVKNL